MEIIARVVTVTIVKVVTTQIAKVATTAVLLMATIAPLTATMTVRMVVAVPTTVLLVLTMTKDQADLYTPSQEGAAAGDGMKKRRPRVGDTRVNSYDSRDNRGGGRPSYGNNNRGGGYGNNNGYGNRRPGGQQRRTNDYNPNAKYNFQKQLKYKEVLADPNEPIRLNKFLSNAGVCSRREADEFITAGAVKVNDVVVTELGTKITRQDKVEFNDKPVQIESKVYIVLNKPKNCVTTSDDPQERLTVMDLVKNACQERLFIR